MRINVIIVILTGASILFGCTDSEDRYQLIEKKDGQVVRLDKKTGGMAILNGEGLVGVNEPTESSKLLEPIDWGHIAMKQSGIDSVYLSTIWREERVFYKLRIIPVPKNFNSYGSFDTLFILFFYDEHGFKMIEEGVVGSSLLRYVDSLGVANGLSANSSFIGSRELYSNLGSWSLRLKF